MVASSFHARANLGMTGENPSVGRDVLHQKTHEGKLFVASRYESSVSAASSRDTLVVVPSGGFAHLRAYCPGEISVKVELFKSTTITAAGTTITSYNTNQNSSNTAGVTVSQNPTLTASGTTVFTTLNPGGYGIQASNIFGGDGEFVLPAGNYLLRTTNVGSSAGDICANLIWYET